MSERVQLEARLLDLKTEHRDLDEAIAVLSGDSASDALQVKRLKKRKLALKDQIAVIENRLQPPS
ncbi:MAG: YdcH family protein [Alphaproteobacteria bacterium]|nr:YdcH family protein [Alphaproteobacteria bacterium]